MNINKAGGTCRVLAIDARPRWFGYAAFASPTRLLDFGIKRFALRPAGGFGFAALLKFLRPEVIVLRKISRGSWRDRTATKAVMRTMRRLCRQSSIRVAFVSEVELRACFKAPKLRTKQERASLIARNFPVLAWRLPPPRKTWRHEHWNMPIFDAVALGTAYLAEANREKNDQLQHTEYLK